jgi:hypothetical protein
MRKGAGVVELAALEMLCTSKGYRGFESHPFRHLNFGIGDWDFGFLLHPRVEIRHLHFRIGISDCGLY